MTCVRHPLPVSFGTVACLIALALPVVGQEPDLEAGLRVERIEATPPSFDLVVGEPAVFDVTALDARGNPVETAALRVSSMGPFQPAGGNGRFMVTEAGEFAIIVSVVLPPDADREPPTLRVPVTVRWPAVERVEVETGEGTLYAGTSVAHAATAFHGNGSERPSPEVRWSSSDEEVATVDRFGSVTAHAPGAVTITAEVGGVEGSVRHDVAPFPGASLELVGGEARARTGDVLAFDARILDDAGERQRDVPVTWSLDFTPDDSIHAPGAGGILRDGRFVGEVPGRYTVVATAGPLLARRTVDVRPRDVVRDVRILGQGTVDHVHTSDLWIYEGVDGRDYAVTGTWGGDGWAYFWDVTDPASPVRTDSIQLDARTVNDVKVSPDARYAALSREGASNRRNGVVILDLGDPAHPVVASTYDDGLTGGVHNMFATEDHLFALSAGDKYVILDVTDLENPTYVSEYDHPNSRIHDVWVHDGIAYSSEWGTGVVVVDVGNGRWGGTIEEPVFVTAVPYPVGATHAAFPYHQESTGKFYLFLGDEIMSRRGAAWSGAGLGRIPRQGGTPSVTRGYVHIIDFTDPENPQDVARYEVDEFGTHNMWVEDDVLYQAYYEGGLRIVDVSGELMGNLADQGREIAVYKPFDPDGFVSNAPMVWGAQPHKGNVFMSDFNSGLWVIEVQPRGRPTT